MNYTIINKNNYIIVNDNQNKIIFMCSKEDLRLSSETIGTITKYRFFDIYSLVKPLIFELSETNLTNESELNSLLISSNIISGGTVTKESIGLDKVNNTSDTEKIVSTLQQLAINQAKIEANNYADGLFETIKGVAPTQLDTIKEISDALQNNPQIINNILDSLGKRIRFDIDNQGLSSIEKFNAQQNLGIIINDLLNRSNHTGIQPISTIDGLNSILDSLSNNLFNLSNIVNNKVDKVTGKGLSTNDYDNTEKNKLQTVFSNIDNKVDKVTGKGLSTNDYDNTEKNKLQTVFTNIDNKVDKVTGKGLSTNDYDNTEKNKLQTVFTNNTFDETNISIQNKLSQPQYYYVLVIAGQSNMCNYGEGTPSVSDWNGTFGANTYPNSWSKLGLDDTHPRIKQLSRGNDLYAVGTPSNTNSATLVNNLTLNTIVPATHCLEHAQDMRGMGGVNAPNNSGTVGAGLSIAKKLLSIIPPEAGILIVPCSFGGTAFTTGTDATFDNINMRTSTGGKWGVSGGINNGGTVNLPISNISFQYGVGVGTAILSGRYCDMITRTAIALGANPKNKMLGVLWGQGEFDQTGTPNNHSAMFDAMVTQFGTDLNNNLQLRSQCPNNNANQIPWICMGDSTYHWRNSVNNFANVYQSYFNSTKPNVQPVIVGWNYDGTNVQTNLEDTNDLTVGRYGNTGNVSTTKQTHFSSNSFRGVVAKRFAETLIKYVSDNNLLEFTDRDTIVNLPLVYSFNANKNTKPSVQGWAVENEATLTLATDSNDIQTPFTANIVPTSTISNFVKIIKNDDIKSLWLNGGVCKLKIKPTPGTSPGTGRFLTWVGISSGLDNSAGSASKQFLKLLVRTGASNANIIEVCYSIGATHTVITSVPYSTTSWINIDCIFFGSSNTVRFIVNGVPSTVTYTMQTNDFTVSRGALVFSTVSATTTNLCNHSISLIELTINQNSDTSPDKIIQGNLSVNNKFFSNKSASRFLGGLGNTPILAAGAGAGTTPTLGTPTGSNVAINTTLTTGTTPSAGILFTGTFSNSYNVAPIPVFTPGNGLTTNLGIFIKTTTTGFTVSCQNAPVAAKQYIFNILFIGN